MAKNTAPAINIGISEKDIARYGWPIDDSLLCRAIDRLTAAGIVTRCRYLGASLASEAPFGEGREAHTASHHIARDGTWGAALAKL